MINGTYGIVAFTIVGEYAKRLFLRQMPECPIATLLAQGVVEISVAQLRETEDAIDAAFPLSVAPIGRAELVPNPECQLRHLCALSASQVVPD